MRGWIRIDHSFWMQPEIAFRKRAPHPEISARRDRRHVLHPRDRGWFLNDDLRHKFPRVPRRDGGHREAQGEADLRPGTSTASLSRLFRSEEHTSELQSLMRISYAVFCLKKNNRSETDI